jgi:signal transduction histidine kinase
MAIDQISLMRVFDMMSEGVFVLDPDWRILYANDSGRRYLGLSEADSIISEDLRPKLLSDFVLSTDLMAFASDSDNEHSINFEAANPDDRSFDLTLSLYMSRQTDDGTRILLIRDITEEQRDKALKRDFLSFISHKLRTPVSTLKVSLSNLRDGVLGNLNEQQVESLDISQRKVQTLEKIIDKLITFTTLRDERLQAERCQLDIQKATRKFAERFARECPGTSPNLRFAFDEPEAVTSMREHLFETILESILDNAVKFSIKARASIAFSCQRHASTGEIILAISDDGPGMPPAVQKTAFQAFTQRDDEFTGNTAGLGLGLTTVQYLMTLYGGRVGLESQPGRGTTVKLVFPLSGTTPEKACAE